MPFSQSDSWLQSLLATVGAMGVALAGVWGWLATRARLRASPPAEETKAEAELQAVWSESAMAIIRELRDQRAQDRKEWAEDHARSREEIAGLKATIKTLNDKVAGLEEEGDRCRKEYEALTEAYDGLWEHVETLSKALMNSAITEAARKDLENTIVHIEGGRASVMRLARRPPHTRDESR
ncbi:hypothetical protein [Phenylobacterium sp.]|uniref:hypothetical protein n=1 Tax=Phenylobacterium sp. TaxID=1871053 RepID=UPI004036E257